MKKFSFLMSMALMALMLVPTSMKAEQISPTLTFIGADGSPVSQVEVTLGENFNAPRLTCDYVEVLPAVTYRATNSSVATIDETGAVTIVGAGQAMIIAMFNGNDNYYPARASYTLTVVESSTPQPEPTCPEGRFFSNGAEVTSLTLQVGGRAGIPMLITSTGEVISGGRATIENSSVATISADNLIHGVAAGSTVLHVMTATTINGQVLTCDYSLPVTVEGSSIPQPTCPEASYYFNGAELTTMTLTVGDTVSIPTLMGATGSIYRLSAKTVEGILVAELTDDDQIHAVGAGTATFIGLYLHRTTDDSTMQCEYSFNIVVEAAAQQKLDPELSFTPAQVEAELGETFTAPTLNNTHNVPIDKWYGSNENVATVDEATGAVTIVGLGTAQIYCESNETEVYNRGIAYYTLNVTTMNLTVAGVTVTKSNATDILGDGSISYDPITHTLTMTNAMLSGSMSTLGAPAVKRASQDNTQAAIEYTAHGEPLTIMLNGGNAISNMPIGILATFDAVVIRSTNGGTLRIVASTAGLKAQALKVSQCSTFFTGGSIAIGVNDFSVDKNSYVVASAPIAIQAKTFSKAEDNNGEGVDILTAGVVFKQNKGFVNQSDMSYASNVEIGKMVVVPTTTEVTTIDFTQTDPSGNETVIFSADANNSYNESTGQLEITTSLTDEAVETALETLVPGSSEWIDLLPGSLVFDIPAGQGKVRIQCMTLPGYTLQVKLEGEAAVSLTQTELGWAEVEYNVTEPIHVVIYLHANAPSSAPARIATNMQDDDPIVGAYIQAVKIAPKDAPDPNPTTAIDIIEANQDGNGKILMNGQLFVIRDGRVYTATGAQVK